MIVVDTNVLAYLFIEGDKTTFAQKVYKTDPRWIVPELWRHEFLNILTTLARTTKLDIHSVQTLWKNVFDSISPLEKPINFSLALELAHHGKVSSYDAQFVALAAQHGVFCISEDAKLRRAFPEFVKTMAEFCE